MVGKDSDEIGSGLITGRFQGIVVELLDAVLNFEVDLGASQSTVDTRGSFCRVATKEV